jgi:hypothetical protein
MSNQHHEIDTYWNSNLVIGEGEIEGKRSLIRLKLHRSDDKYYSPHELFPLSSRRGQLVYFHAKPYILIPKITLTVALSRPKADTGEIGKVIGANVQHLQQRDIGNAQAWYYPADKALVLWECFLEEPYQTAPDPRHDAVFTMVWTGFERLLLEQLHPVERIYTTYEPIYERPVFAKFLATQGFRKQGNITFVKEVSQPVKEITSV